MSDMAFQITGISIVCSNVCSDGIQTRQQSSTSLAFVRGIPGERWFPSQRANNAANVSIWRRHQGMHGSLFCTNPLSEPIMAKCSTNVSLDFNVFTIDDNEKVYRNLLSILQATVLHIKKSIFMNTYQSWRFHIYDTCLDSDDWTDNKLNVNFPFSGKNCIKHPSMGLLLW